jgi:uncharacterized protein YjbI with pentapeptide repeats
VRFDAGQIVDCGPKLVANPEHLALIRQGVDAWNKWRARKDSIVPDLSGAHLADENLGAAYLSRANLREANLGGADLSCAFINNADLSGANLRQADLFRAHLADSNLNKADLTGASLGEATLNRAQLIGAHLIGASLTNTYLVGANLAEANLAHANLVQADLCGADLSNADFSKANLIGANLRKANLSGADLSGANIANVDLSRAVLIDTRLAEATVNGCRIYGVSTWNVKVNDGTKQQNLVITEEGEPEITVDSIEVAQFVYLLLHNEKIRDVIDTIGRKGVLLLGRFTEGRIAVLERLRDELRKRGYLPIVFNFDKPETKDFTETVRLLAGLSKFVIADITNPKSAPLELQATIPEIMVPFRPIIEEGEKPFAMLEDLWIKHRDWVFEPIHYSSVEALITSLDEKIIRPAEARFVELLKRKADTMGGEHI